MHPFRGVIIYTVTKLAFMAALRYAIRRALYEQTKQR
jgi:hypothetical protein